MKPLNLCVVMLAVCASSLMPPSWAAAPRSPSIRANPSTVACVASKDAKEALSTPMRSMADARWADAASQFEALLQEKEVSVAALYAAYAHAKMANMASARQLTERAVRGRSCLTARERAQLVWMASAYNEQATIPALYARSGGVLSVGKIRARPTPQDIEQRHSEALSACDLQESLDLALPPATRSNKTKCIEAANRTYAQLRFKYRDPCNVLARHIKDPEEVNACLDRYASGVFEPLKGVMPP